jgi:hypothetical protein
MIQTRWIRVRRDQREGTACRVITLSSATGAAEFEAVAFTWRRDIVVRAIASPHEGFVIRRRRSFPFTGRLDVLATAGETRIGILARNGVVKDGSGNACGRFRDARTTGDRAGETAFEFVGAILTGSEGGDPGRMPLERRWIIGSAEQGRLMRAKWPFDPDGAPDPSPGGISRFLPAKVGAFLRGVAAPATWRFDWRPLEPSVDPRLPVAAALWAVELSHW